MVKYVWVALILAISGSATAAQWSNTEIHLQHGDLLNPFSDEDARTTIVTFQHASGWQYGSHFFFLDYLQDDTQDGFNDRTFYGEWYPFFSASRLLGMASGGVVRDWGLVLGVNASAEAKVLKYLPGVQVNWQLPGFAFFNTLFTAYLDDSAGLAQGGAPQEEASWMLDIAFAYPFTLAGQSLSLEGHAEYITGRDLENIAGKAKPWMLAQPQLRWDIGKALWAAERQLHLGVEYQYWHNKLGSDETESTLQLLLVWSL